MVFETLKEMIVNELNLKEDVITPEARIIEDLGADSIDAANLIFEIEDKFEIALSDEETQNIKTVGDLIKIIESKK